MDHHAQQLARRLTGLAAKRPGFVVGLWGEPGVGKTHTALGLLRGTPLKSLTIHATQAMTAMLATMPQPKNPSDWLERSLERLARGETPEQTVLVQTFAGLLTANAPLVLHVEDLHEAAPERLGFWCQLAQAVPRTRGTGLIFTSRTQLPEGIEAIRLAPLSREASDALLESETGAPLPHEALAWVFEHAAGNPLFTLEFFRFLARQGFLWNDAQRWRWRKPEQRLMPSTVEALIEQQLHQVSGSEPVRRVLEAKALLPMDCSPAILAAVAGMDQASLEAAQTVLVQQGILTGTAFAHPLLREVRLATLRPERKLDLARRAIVALEHDPIQAIPFVEWAALTDAQNLALFKRAAAEAASLGDTALQGKLLARAADHVSGVEQYQVALEAAQILQRMDLPTAVRLGELALRLKPHDTQTLNLLAHTFALRNERDRVEWALAQMPEEERGPKGLPRLVRLYSTLGDDERVLELVRQNPALMTGNPETLYDIAWSLLGLGHRDQLETLIAQTLARNDLSEVSRAGFNYLKGIVLSQYGGDDTAAEPCFLEALLGYRRAGNSVNIIAGLHAHATVLQNVGRYQDALPELQEAAQLCAQLGSITRLAETNVAIADQLQWFGQYEQAEHLYSESLEILRQHKDTSFLLDCLRSLVELYWFWDVPYGPALAFKHANEALSLARVTDNPNRMLKALRALVLACVQNRQPARALEFADEALRLAIANDQPNQVRNAHHARAIAFSACGGKDEALQSIRESMRWAEQIDDPYSTRLIGLELARLTNDVTLARTYLGWFEAHGLINGVHLARRFFPEITPLMPSASEPNTSLRLEVLGPMQMVISGTAEPVRGGKRKEFLAMLLEARLSGRQEVSRLDLLDALYPEAEETQANAALKDVVHQVRSSLGMNAVQTSPNGYTLGEVSSDAEDFLRTGDTRLWRGAYLDGLGFGPRGETAREALYFALRSRAGAILETDAGEAARLGRLLCEADPYDLEGLRLTLRALRAMSNHKSLTRTYTQARERWLDVGETLPERWADFLEPSIGATA